MKPGFGCEWLLLAAGLALAAPDAGAATITIVNSDGAGEGFNDPTVVAPIGGNPGTTRGMQRLNVFNQAAAIWGGILPSAVTILVEARFNSLTPCNATSGVLGSAGPIPPYASNFPGAEFSNTVYPIALANKLRGSDLNPGVNDITATFNSDVDNGTCLGASNWYYGYDGNNGTNVDLLPVVLHELGHGLGFINTASVTTGVYAYGSPDVFSRFILDTDSGLHWHQMTNAQRQASAINTDDAVWDGAYVTSRAREILSYRPFVRIEQPAGIAGEKVFGTAAFGASLPNPALTDDVILVTDGVATSTDGCEPFTNEAAVAGNIALIDRGNCTFVQKVGNAQGAGAVAVIIGNNVAGAPPLMGGDDPGLVIPVVSVTLDDANAIKANLGAGVVATLGLDDHELAGADENWKVKLYAPNPVEPGSSISHWDDSAVPNLLMEPFINDDLGSGIDLTRWLFEDIGWFPRLAGVGDRPFTLRVQPASPNPFRGRTALRYELDRPGLAQVDVFDLGGRMVRHLVRAWQPAGEASVTWDGTDEGGRRAAPGVYLYRVRAGATSETRRMVLLD